MDLILVVHYTILHLGVDVIHLLIVSFIPDYLTVFVDYAFVDEGLELRASLNKGHPQLIAHYINFALQSVESFGTFTGKPHSFLFSFSLQFDVIYVHCSMSLSLICFWLISFRLLLFFKFLPFLDWSTASCSFVINEALLGSDFGVEEEMAVRSYRSYTLRNYLIVCVLILEATLLLISVFLVLRFLCLLPSFLDAGAWLTIVVLIR